jgi:DNA-binding response OmpR family regulator
MIEEIGMRIIAIGTKLMTERLILALAGSEFELLIAPEMLEAIVLLKQDKFDLVVVDSLAKGIETTCRRIRELGSVPMVLMIGQKQLNWKEIQSLEIDGYIPQGVNGAELVARLRALTRRLEPDRQVREKVVPHYQSLMDLSANFGGN